MRRGIGSKRVRVRAVGGVGRGIMLGSIVRGEWVGRGRGRIGWCGRDGGIGREKGRRGRRGERRRERERRREQMAFFPNIHFRMPARELVGGCVRRGRGRRRVGHEEGEEKLNKKRCTGGGRGAAQKKGVRSVRRGG